MAPPEQPHNVGKIDVVGPSGPYWQKRTDAQTNIMGKIAGYYENLKKKIGFTLGDLGGFDRDTATEILSAAINLSHQLGRPVRLNEVLAHLQILDTKRKSERVDTGTERYKTSSS